MINIIVKYQVKPEYTDSWLDRTRAFTEAVRAEPGCQWFDWYHSVEDPHEFVLLEAFQDDAAAKAHVESQHFQDGIETMKPLVAEVPKIISRKVEGDGWDLMGEMQ